MYFNSKDDTNIDKEFNHKIKFNSKIFIIIGVILLIIILIIILTNHKRTKYYITLIGDNNIKIYQNDKYIEPGYKAITNHGDDLTDKVIVDSQLDMTKIGEYIITYTLENTSVKRKISVVEKPIGFTQIYLKGNLYEYLSIGDNYNDPGYIVVDSVDGDKLKDKVIVSGIVDTSKSGTYKLVYSVINSSGITTSVTRTIIVMNGNINLTLDNNEYTNSDINIKIYIKDPYFDYLILPNGKKISRENYPYNYKVSENGTYKFVSYNTLGKSNEESITVNNIDREVPSGSCQGSYQSGVSTIVVNASDNVGIRKYVIDGTSYTNSNIKINKEIKIANITIYDKAGNTKNISCTLKDNNSYTTPSIKNPTTTPKVSTPTVTPRVSTPTPTYDSPINPVGNENIKYNVSTDSLKVWMEKKSSYYISHIWAKNPYNQLNTAIPEPLGSKVAVSSSILNEVITKKNLNNSLIVAINGSGFVQNPYWSVGLYKANHAWNNSSMSPIVIVDGAVLRDFSTSYIPSWQAVYGLKSDGYLAYYTYTEGNNNSYNISSSKKIINDGVKYTFAFSPVLVENGKKSSMLTNWTDSTAVRQAICQINKNNFIFITGTNATTLNNVAEQMISLGCQTGFNLDGGGSTSLIFKDKNSNPSVIYGNQRQIADIVYFHE